MASTRARQRLIPGIPDDLTVQYIAAKLNWETCNVLQMVSREWQHVICNRSVYNAKVQSKSTEPYLVLLWGHGHHKISLILFSCKGEYPLQLPPIPVASPCKFDCICLDGNVYVWVRTDIYCNSEWGKICLWVLDLAGDKKWTRHDQGKHSTYEFGFNYGVLDGRIYRFRGSFFPVRGLLEGGSLGRDSDELAMDDFYGLLPQTEVYDPLSHVWSFVTPATSFQDDLPYPAFDEDLDSLSKWAKKEFGEDPSKSFLTHGRYEPYFSEWRRRQAADCSTSSAIHMGYQDATALQVYYTEKVYYKNESHLADSMRDEAFFFFGGKLLKCRLIDTYEDVADHSIINMFMYDVQKKTWEQWKSISAGFQSLDEGGFFCQIFDFASTDNVIWAFMEVTDGHLVDKYSLVRTPVSLSGDNDEPLTWTDTAYSLDGSQLNCVKLRPIYV